MAVQYNLALLNSWCYCSLYLTGFSQNKRRRHYRILSIAVFLPARLRDVRSSQVFRTSHALCRCLSWVVCWSATEIAALAAITPSAKDSNRNNWIPRLRAALDTIASELVMSSIRTMRELHSFGPNDRKRAPANLKHMHWSRSARGVTAIRCAPS